MNSTVKQNHRSRLAKKQANKNPHNPYKKVENCFLTGRRKHPNQRGVEQVGFSFPLAALALVRTSLSPSFYLSLYFSLE